MEQGFYGIGTRVSISDSECGGGIWFGDMHALCGALLEIFGGVQNEVYSDSNTPPLHADKYSS